MLGIGCMSPHVVLEKQDACKTLPPLQGFKALYPPQGGKSAVEVVADDLDKLAEKAMLNDTIVDLGIR
jgi:Ulp1 family protease